MCTLLRALSTLSALALFTPTFSYAQSTNSPVAFGSIAVGSPSAPATLTFPAPNGSLSLYLTYGPNTDFILGSTSCSAGVCSLPVTFQPSMPGVRRGAVSAFLGNALQSVTPLSGVGAGSQLSLGPGLMTTVASRTNQQLATASIFGVAARSSNQIYVADSANHQIFSVTPQTGQVQVVAGTGVPGFSGDGGAASAAKLYQPSGLAIDNSGNLLIADTNNQRVRKLDLSTGIITTVAGNGSATFAGDGGLAVNASLNSPSAIAVLSNGDFAVSDTLNARVRVVLSASGNITTIAGNGAAGFNGDGSALSAQLNGPLGLAVDSNDNIYIADVLNDVVRKLSGGVLTTVAGQGTVAGSSGDGGAATGALLSFPYGVVVDAAGDLYIADDRNNVIRKVTGDSSHTISTIGGSVTAGYLGDGGSALSARLNGPSYLSKDDLGNLYIVDSGNSAVRRISTAASPVSFPLTSVGSPSNSILTVSNTGNQTLNVSGISTSSNFALTGGTCGATPALSSGQSCTAVLSFTPTSGGVTSGTVSLASNSLNAGSTPQSLALSQSNGLYFVPVTPCRAVDTRFATGAFGPPALVGGTSRNFTIGNSSCAGVIPAGAQAYSLNVTVVPRSSLNFLTVYPTGSSLPLVSNLNSYDGRTKANAAIVSSGSGGSISVFATDNTDLILDIDGYFVPQSTAGALAYYPLPPCRAADTRPPGLLGGSVMAAGETRNFALAGHCNLPTTAQAYALNFTAIPQNGMVLPWITTWPAGQPQPLASTLNATTGATTANAAIVPAGASGNISVYAQGATDLIIDVSGYYAPATSAPAGLGLYNTTPCRAYDSRPGFNSGASVVNIQTGCSVPSVAQSFVLNATVTPATVPASSLGFLTLWAQGSAQPLQSTLDAYDGAVTSNLAFVPTSNGIISVFTSSPAGLIFDLFGYFAP